jgi:hypothetical protein
MAEKERRDHPQRRAGLPLFRISIFRLIRRFDGSTGRAGIAGLVGQTTRGYANDDIGVGSIYIAAVGPFFGSGAELVIGR